MLRVRWDDVGLSVEDAETNKTHIITREHASSGLTLVQSAKQDRCSQQQLP